MSHKESKVNNNQIVYWLFKKEINIHNDDVLACVIILQSTCMYSDIKTLKKLNSVA
jgi:hypothetical protein